MPASDSTDYKKLASDLMVEATKQLITLAAGFIVVSASVLALIGRGSHQSFWLLPLSWGLFVASMISAIFALGAMAKTTHDYERIDLDEVWTKWLLRSQQIMFVWGVIFFIVFGTLNLWGRADSSPSPEGLATPPGSVNNLSDAINNLASSLSATTDRTNRPAASPGGVPWIGIAVVVVFGGGGLLIAGLSNPTWVRWVGIGTAALTLGGVTAVKVGEIALKPDLHLHSSVQASSLVCVDHVGPFVSGEADILESTPIKPPRTPGDIVKDLATQAKDRQLVQLVLIGSADKFELLPSLRARYGSNTGLARVRADWVQQELSNELLKAKFSPATYLTLIVGPAKHGPGLTSNDVGPDRSVAVCPVWREQGSWLDWLLRGRRSE